MDGWNQHDRGGFNRIGVCSGRLRFFTIEKEPTFLSRNNFSANRDEDSHILVTKMPLERKVDGIPVRKIFISNIPKETKNRDLYMLFKQFGEIVNVFVSKKYSNDEYKKTTFGFITFKNTEGAARAICHKKLSLGSKKLYVTEADSWHQPIVNPDGSVEYNSSFSYSKRVDDIEKKETDDGNQSDGTDDIDGDIAGAVGGIVLSSLSSQEAELCPISRLNDDCLEHIFSELTLDTQIVASKVCKRWQDVISDMCRKIETVNFIDYFPDGVVEMDRVLAILEKIGPNLKEIIFNSDDVLQVNKSFISIVARYCRKLEVLEIANVEIAKRSFLFLARQCPNLRKVTFSGCTRLTDNELTCLIRRENCKLEEINLIQITDIFGNFFNHLQPPLKHISIDRCLYVKPEFLMLGITRVKDSLVSLTLKNCMSTYSYDISSIASAVPNLKFFNLSDVYPFSSSFSLEPVGKFTELRSLDLSNNYLVSDSIITVIADGCKSLQSLNLSGVGSSGTITQSGIVELGKIQMLEELDVSRVDQISDESVRLMTCASSSSRIKKFTCFNCQNLSDRGAMSILSSYNDLEYFDIRNCLSVTNETVKKALSIVKKRSNSLPLKMMIYGTNVSILDESSFSHPFLHLDFTDDSIFQNLLDEFFLCGNGNDDLCRGLDCQCCVGFDDEDDFMTDSDEEIDDFLMEDYEGVESDFELGSDECQFYFDIM